MIDNVAGKGMFDYSGTSGDFYFLFHFSGIYLDFLYHILESYRYLPYVLRKITMYLQ